jgi:hypothetical protein
MRKLILISALLLASASAQAQVKAPAVASNDERIETVQPAAQAKPQDVKTEAATTTTAATTTATTTTATTTDTAKPEVAAKPETSKPSKRADFDFDEATARKMAARYGIRW